MNIDVAMLAIGYVSTEIEHLIHLGAKKRQHGGKVHVERREGIQGTVCEEEHQNNQKKEQKVVFKKS